MPTEYMSRNPVMTQPTCASDAPKSSLMTGTATFTIELFKTETKTAEMSTARSRRVETCLPAPAALKPRPRPSRPPRVPAAARRPYR
jgi:hypothetical protein